MKKIDTHYLFALEHIRKILILKMDYVRFMMPRDNGLYYHLRSKVGALTKKINKLSL